MTSHATKEVPASESQTPNQTGSQQSPAKLREQVTPYAFAVAEVVIGTPLASPFRRAMSLLVDLLLVALLSGVSGSVLAIIIAVLVWRSGRRLSRRKTTTTASRWLKVLAGVLLLLGMVGVFTQPLGLEFSSDPDSAQSDEVVVDEAAFETLVFGGHYLIQIKAIEQQIASGECAIASDCWQRLATELVSDLHQLQAQHATKQALLTQFFELSAQTLSATELEQLQEQTRTWLAQTAPSQADKVADENDANQVESPRFVVSESAAPASFSVISFVQGIAADLGLGFGWAAAYFTATMVWLNGQTVGKRLFGIKVIKLDGSQLNVWESFGRYGGYGAGLATGLLGFLQIFWDPNRQAIQDKISETLVIRLTDLNSKRSNQLGNE